MGDFNVIIDTAEKFGGIPIRKSFDLIGVIEARGLTNLGYHGQRFTWSNLRGINFRIWKRLYKAIVQISSKKRWLSTSKLIFLLFGQITALFYWNLRKDKDTNIRYFKFLNC